ncbi:phage tail tube protein [Fodinicola feengrottensis]|uniref:phage tail tube protein n=1 Tax=Fodinicola feengrottensis TaxID=435914 RepID=UPI002441ADC7|nr:phage tail tube protein [Fodinicola feengrottensis]
MASHKKSPPARQPPQVCVFFEFNSETHELKKTVVEGKGLHAGGQYDRAARRAYVKRDVNGGFDLNVANKGFGLLLQNMLGSFSATAVQIGVTGAYKQVHAPGSLQGKTMTVQKGVPQTNGTVIPITYTGVKFSDWEISCKEGEIATLKLTVDAWDELNPNTSPAGPALATASYPVASEFHFAQANLLLGGTATTTSGVTSVASGVNIASVTNCSIKQSNPFKADRYFYGSNGRKAEQIENATHALTGQLDVEFVTQAAVYDLFTSDAAVALEVSFVGPSIGASNYTLDIIIPNIHFDGETPKIGGPDVLSSMTMPFTGLDDQVNNPIQITYISTDTAV